MALRDQALWVVAGDLPFPGWRASPVIKRTTEPQVDSQVAGAPARRELTRRTESGDAPSANRLIGQSDTGIVLTWLARLRWFALLGQSAAVAIAALAVGLALPWAWLGAIMAVTALTNVVLQVGLARRREWPTWFVPALLLLDVTLLTLMLAATGGPRNPFCELYLIHVALSVVAVSPPTTWIVAGVAVGSFALLFVWSRPLSDQPLPAWTFIFGTLGATAISAGLLVYFLGRMRTTLRQRERELRDMQRRIEHGERLTGLSTLAAGAAHELGTPLATIAVVAHELQRSLGGSDMTDAARQDLELIRTQVDRCRSILDRMNVERLAEQGDLSATLNVDELIEDVRRELKPGCASRLVVERSPRLHTLGLPLGATEQALIILIQNAFDASPADASVELAVAADGSEVIFRIRDHGEGIPADLLARLGEPFVTNKAPNDGMGLGLFLARSLAEALGGRLLLESTAGQGTTAILELPLQPVERR